jgi:hypothetical protein
MKKKNWYLLVFSVLFIACSNPGIDGDTSQSKSNVLRGLVFNSTEKTDFPLPVSIYVFDSSDKCVDMQTLLRGDETFSFLLSPGSYTLSVISGASTEKYYLPDIKNATPNSPLILKSSGDTHAELTAKTKNITVGNNDVEDLIVIVKRVISQITASINDVPEDVTSVSIRLQSLEEQLLLNGSYGGDGNGQASFTLNKESSGLWKTPTPVFVLPGDEVSVTVTFKDENSSHDYVYATTVSIEANYKTDILATYKAKEAELSGSIQYSDWEDERQIIFDFGEGASGENIEMLTQGDIYKGCYILDVIEESPEESTFLLMAPKGIVNMTMNNIYILEKYEYEELIGWRVLSVKEAENLYNICSRLDELNSLLTNEGITPMKPDAKYLCMDSEQKLCHFTINTPGFNPIPVTDNNKHDARIVKEVTVKWKSKSGK